MVLKTPENIFLKKTIAHTFSSLCVCAGAQQVMVIMVWKEGRRKEESAFLIVVWRQNGELPEQVACSCQETCVSLSSQQEGSFSSKTAWEGWGAGTFSLFWRQQCLGFAEAGFLLFERLQGTVSAFHLNDQCLHLEVWYLFPLSVEKTLTSYPAVGGWRVCHSLLGQGGRDYIWVGWWWGNWRTELWRTQLDSVSSCRTTLAAQDWSQQHDEDAQSPWQPAHRQSCYLAIPLDLSPSPPRQLHSLFLSLQLTHNSFSILLCLKRHRTLGVWGSEGRDPRHREREIIF